MTIPPNYNLRLDLDRDQPGGPSTRGNNRLAAIFECPRAHYLRYIAGLRTLPDNEPGYRLIGTLFHAGAAEYHARLCTPAPWWAGLKSPEARVREQGEGRPQEVRIALEMLDYYMNFVDPPRGWRPFMVEREFRVPLGKLAESMKRLCPEDVRDEIVSTRPDLGVEINGHLWCVDHKSSAPRTGSSVTAQLPSWNDEEMLAEHGWQMALMSLLVRAELPDVQPQVMIQRVKRTLPYAVLTDLLVIPQPMLADVFDTLVEAVRRERLQFERMAAGEKPAGNFKACRGRYGLCDFYGACHATTRQERLFILETGYRRV